MSPRARIKIGLTLSAFATYRAPTRHGEALILPGLDQAAAVIGENRRRQAQWELTLCGERLEVWREQARNELLRDAIRYSQSYRDVTLPAGISGSRRHVFVMFGHQPTLFHPGVWFKNFAIAAIQQRVSRLLEPGAAAVAINLVIDNDVAASSSIRVPHRDPQTGQIGRQTVAYDSAAGGVPFEQNRIRDRATFDAFAEAVCDVIAPLVPNPLVTQLWPHAVAAAQRCENVSCALAQARHVLEGEQGLQTLELPLSVLCRSEAFAAFVLTLIGDAGRLRTIYNQSAAEYRQAHGIRSSAHPVPNLAAEDDWTEVPLWIYSDHSPQRRGAWVRRQGDVLEISDRQRLSIRVTHPADTRAAAAELIEQCGPHFKLRPRALLTTMYARLLLSDVFVHGIGGAKYDELGDEITRRLFGIEPPKLMVVSATMLLPTTERLSSEVPSVAELRQQIRQTWFAPERFADRVELPEALLQAKRELIANRPGMPCFDATTDRFEPSRNGSLPSSKKVWHDRLASINAELAAYLQPLRDELSERLPEARQAESAASILNSREHPFCLFPLQELMDRFTENLSE